ncbi:MAG TPA: hypothetical protein VEA81_15135 [Burkholderiaceae bacterium]|nr:hypothetical protein [Burkholderiaceae bacterium]
MKRNVGKQTKPGTSQKPLAAKAAGMQKEAARIQDRETAVGIGKVGQEADTGRGDIDHHQSNHGRRER